jgi:alpha-tubulin suppressor-like RCC1 family protein
MSKNETKASFIVSQGKVNSWTNIDAIAAADETLFGRKADGGIVRTIYNFGSNEKKDFQNLTKVVTGGGYLAGLKSDGTVLTWGVSGEDFGVSEVSGWSNITDIAASEDGLLGLKADGTVLVIGEAYQEVKDWKDICQISLGAGVAVGRKADGSLVAVGYEDDIVREVEAVSAAKQVSIAPNGRGVIVVLENGTLRTIGSYWRDQEAGNVVYVAKGNSYAAVVHENGTVSVDGSGGYANVYSWKNIKSVAVGAEHTVGLKEDGTVVVAGSNSNGQCNVSNWTDVIYIDAGEYFTLGVKSDGSLLIAGKMPGEY